MTTATRIQAKPFIKWAGGKGAIFDQIAPYFPLQEVNTYFEPFLGGGAVFFGLWSLEPSRLPWQNAWLADSNYYLVNAYQQIRNRPYLVMGALDMAKDMFYAGGQEFYDQSKRKLLHTDSVTQAALFIFLNKTCFNGLWRVGPEGFNVPLNKAWLAHPEKLNLYDEGNILACSEALKGAVITCQNYDMVAPSKGDFAYLDPPYWPRSTSSSFTSYTSDGFRAEDQVRLMQWTKRLSANRAQWLMSNSDTPFIRALYEDHSRIVEIQAPRSINRNGQGRGKVGELLITNYTYRR